MKVNIEGDDDEGVEVLVGKVEGEKALFGKVKAALTALGKAGFLRRIDEIDELFTKSPELFIETYDEPGKCIYAFRPGVSKLLDRICIKAAELGGGREANAACEELIALSHKRTISRDMN